MYSEFCSSDESARTANAKTFLYTILTQKFTWNIGQQLPGRPVPIFVMCT